MWVRILCGLTMIGICEAQNVGAIASVVNLANDIGPAAPTAGLCPGSYVDISFNLSQYASGATAKPAVTIGNEQMTWGRSVLLNGTSSVQSAQLPWDLPTGTSNLTVSLSGSTSPPYPVTISSKYCPAFINNPNPFRAAASYAGIGAPVYVPSAPASPGDTVFVEMTGLGPTDAAFPVNVFGVSPPAALPVVKIGAEQAQVVSANLVISRLVAIAPEVYEVIFTVPADLAAGDYNVVVSAGGVSSAPLTLFVGNPRSGRAATIVGVSNSASNALESANYIGIAANSFASIYAVNLGAVNSPGNIFPATSFQGVQVLFNNTPVPIYNITTLSSSLTLINVASPQPVAPAVQSYSITISTAGNGTPLTSTAYAIPVVPADLGIFSLPDNANPANRNGAVQFAGTAWDVMPASLAAEYNLGACAGLGPSAACGEPAKPGDKVVIYLTGAGLATPNGDPNGQPLAPGAVAPVDGSVLYKTVLNTSVTIGGVAATVTFSGIVPGEASEYQVNATLPAQFSGNFRAGDAVTLVVTVGNSSGSASDQVTIAIANP